MMKVTGLDLINSTPKSDSLIEYEKRLNVTQAAERGAATKRATPELVCAEAVLGSMASGGVGDAVMKGDVSGDGPAINQPRISDEDWRRLHGNIGHVSPE